MPKLSSPSLVLLPTTPIRGAALYAYMRLHSGLVVTAGTTVGDPTHLAQLGSTLSLVFVAVVVLSKDSRKSTEALRGTSRHKESYKKRTQATSTFPPFPLQANPPLQNLGTPEGAALAGDPYQPKEEKSESSLYM